MLLLKVHCRQELFGLADLFPILRQLDLLVSYLSVHLLQPRLGFSFLLNTPLYESACGEGQPVHHRVQTCSLHLRLLSDHEQPDAPSCNTKSD